MTPTSVDDAWKKAASDAWKPVADGGNLVLQAVRELLAAFPMPGTSVPSQRFPEDSALTQVTQTPTTMTQYQSLAMLAATIRWVAHETSRTEQEIVDELGKNWPDHPPGM